MTDPVTTFSKGGGACGAVRYRVTSTPMIVHACHWVDAPCAKSGVPYPKDRAGPATPVSP